MLQGRFALVVLSLVLSSCRLSANFHEVDAGRYYRSAQLTKKELNKVIPKAGIRTIINLRGESSKKWYRDELEMANKYGVLHYSIRMSAGRIPHREDLIRLLDLFRDAPRPLLVHCKAGADRAGEAAALYQMLYMGKTKEEALGMLTPEYFHLSMFTPAKRYFIEEVWPDQLAGSEQWMRENYDPCAQEYRHYDKKKFCDDTGQFNSKVLGFELSEEEDT